MNDINVLIVNNEQLEELFLSAKTRMDILSAYNKLYVKNRDIYLQNENQEEVKKIEEMMEDFDRRIEILKVLKESMD